MPSLSTKVSGRRCDPTCLYNVRRRWLEVERTRISHTSLWPGPRELLRDRVNHCSSHWPSLLPILGKRNPHAGPRTPPIDLRRPYDNAHTMYLQGPGRNLEAQALISRRHLDLKAMDSRLARNSMASLEEQVLRQSKSCIQFRELGKRNLAVAMHRGTGRAKHEQDKGKTPTCC